MITALSPARRATCAIGALLLAGCGGGGGTPPRAFDCGEPVGKELVVQRSGAADKPISFAAEER